jgi:hypothetical protein
MGDATAEQVLTELENSDRHAYLEQRIFVLSPFGTGVTTLIFLTLFAGSYVLIASMEGLPIVARTMDGIALDSRARIAFTLALLMTTILGVQRYSLTRQRADMLNAAQLFAGGLASVARSTALTPSGARLGLASFAGIMIGMAIIWPAFANNPDVVSHRGIFIWFSVIVLLLTMSFARGVELTRRGSQNGTALIQKELIIDLLRVDQLSFLGRSAARFALIWFAVGALSCLFIVNSGITVFTVGLIAIFLAIGGLTFFGMMEGIHRRIVAAKYDELECVRRRIDAVRVEAATEASAAQRLQGLLAYEARITAAPEWPFDQPTLVRLCASALILTLPWFGQAVTAYLIEHLGSR